MGFVSAIFTRVGEYTVAPITHELGYLFCYENNIDELKKKVDKLQEASDRVQHSIDEARRQGEEIEGNVKNWQDKIDKIIRETKAFEQDKSHDKVGCSSWTCPNLLLRYQLSRKAKEMVENVNIKIQEESSFDRISYCTIPKWTEESPTIADFKEFDSRTVTLTKIMETLKDPSIFMVGVHGLGGVGKTTLVKEVARKSQEDKLFDVVTMAVITPKQELQNIQRDIAEMVGLTFKEEGEIVRAGRLRDRLKQEKTILVILDDIWARLDLPTLGIPFGADHKGCKILMTSRNLETLSSQMDTQKNFSVGVLTEEEAWMLFKDMAGFDDSNENASLKATAEQVSKKCAGLPIALVTVARALKHKKLPAWRDALRQLERHDSRNIANLQKVVDSCIRLSYDHLESEELQGIFLLCASMGHYIFPTSLLKRCVGLGSFKNLFSIGEAQDRLNMLIDKLKASSLLFGDSSDHLTMHDVVRDVALTIASKDKDVFYLRNDKLPKWPDKDQLEKCTAINLLCHDIEEFPEGLNCPRLNLFSTNCKDSSKQIPDGFFKGMNRLNVLDLQDMDLSYLPSSIALLRNLQTLCLDQCILKDIAIIGELKTLKVLSLVDSDIKKLAHEIQGLTQLQLLDLSGCSKLKVIPPKVISSLMKLEDLRMQRSFVRWKDEEPSNENASLTELRELPELSALDIHVRDPSIMPRDLFSERLERYKILIGDVWKSSDYKNMLWVSDYEKMLKVQLNRSIHLEKGLKILLTNVEDLHLDKVGQVNNILDDLNEEGFPHLKKLLVQNNDKIQCIINSRRWYTDVVPFPELESLILDNLSNLENIYNSQISSISLFCKLKVITVRSCNRLKNLFSFTMVRQLSHLLEVEVCDCNSMEEIFTLLNEAEHHDNILPFKSLTLGRLPALTGFSSVGKTSRVSQGKEQDLAASVSDEFLRPMQLFCQKVLFFSVENLNVSDFPECYEIWHKPVQKGSYCNLKSLVVDKCEILSNVISFNLLQFLTNLEELEVKNCSSVETVFDLEELEGETTHAVTIWQLRKLTLFCLPKLKHIWSKDPHRVLHCRKLESVHVSECRSLKVLFPASVAKSLEELEEFEVDSCGVKEIVAREEGMETEESFIFPRVKSLALRKLQNFKSFYPGLYTLEWPLLEKLDVRVKSGLNVLASSELSGLQETSDDERTGQNRQPLVFVEKVTPNLDELKFAWMDEMSSLLSKLPVDIFCKLKVLGLHFSEKQVSFPHWFIQKLSNLEELIVDLGAFKEIFRDATLLETEVKTATFVHLKRLQLVLLEKLEHICKEGSQLDPLLEILEELYVKDCSSLSKLVPSCVAFNHLTCLEVERCDKLKYLITSSTARSLVELKRIRIAECKVIEEIVIVEEDQGNDEISLNKLTDLELAFLPSLKSFCSKDVSFNFPSLERVMLRECTKMEAFCEGNVIASNLKGVKLAEEAGTDRWEGELNSTVKELCWERSIGDGASTSNLN